MYINKTESTIGVSRRGIVQLFFFFFGRTGRKREEDITEKNSTSKVILVLKYFPISPKPISKKFTECETNSQQCCDDHLLDLKLSHIKSLPKEDYTLVLFDSNVSTRQPGYSQILSHLNFFFFSLRNQNSWIENKAFI